MSPGGTSPQDRAPVSPMRGEAAGVRTVRPAVGSQGRVDLGSSQAWHPLRPGLWSSPGDEPQPPAGTPRRLPASPPPGTVPRCVHPRRGVSAFEKLLPVASSAASFPFVSKGKEPQEAWTRSARPCGHSASFVLKPASRRAAALCPALLGPSGPCLCPTRLCL